MLVMRGGHVESAHRVHAIVCDARGRVVASAGDPALETFLRSSAKPFQAAAVLLTGAGEKFGLTDEELALLCASHNGEPAHVALAEGILARLGLRADALRCGALPPMDKESARAAGKGFTPIHHRCSGKHAGMLAASLAMGADPAGYLDAQHPYQQLALRTISTFTGVAPATIGLAVDGCGVPTFCVPLAATATAFARLVRPDELTPKEAAAAKRVATAIVAHPYYVAGRERIDTALMEAAEGRILAKGGAEGFHGVADLETGLGLAVKVEDGATRATHPAVVEACRQLGWLEGRALEVLGDWWRPPVTNVVGREVGHLEPTIDLGR